MTAHFQNAVASLAFILVLAGSAFAMDIPPLPELTPQAAAAHPELAKIRAELVKERGILRDRSQRQRYDCGEVEEGTAADGDCTRSLEALTKDVEAHIRASREFIASFEAVFGKATTFTLAAIQTRGEFYIVTADGRRFTGSEAAGVEIDNHATAVTGPNGHAILILPDGTSFTVGRNSEIVLDDFVYEPNTSVRKMSVKLTKGGFRWVTGKVAPRIVPKVDLPVVAIGIRGTDFECSVEAGGEGFVKLYSGELELTPKDGGALIRLTGGQMVTFSGTVIDIPRAIPAGA